MFYGWVIVALAFATLFIVIGTLLQTFAVFLLPLAQEFGVGRAEASIPMVLISAAGVVVMPLFGRLVGTYSIRNIMLFGTTVLALGFFGISLAPSWWVVLAFYGIAGSIAMSSVSLSCSALIVNWFERRRAMALGISLFGMSISGAVLAPVATWAIEAWGLRAAYQGYACLALLLLPFVAFFAVSRPSDLGLAPDGDAAPAEPHTAGAQQEAPLASTRELLSSRSLWLISATCGMVFFGATGVVTHAASFAQDRGITDMQAATLVSGIFVGAAFGKLFFGWLADRLGERGAFAVALVFCASGVAGLLNLGGYPVLASMALLFGLGFGGFTPLQSALMARAFGSRDFAPAMGLAGPLMLPFQVTGPPLAGWIRDTRGEYDLALWIFLAAMAISAVVLSLIRLPGKASAATAEPASDTRAELDPA